jgi:hypothetical protein
MVVEKAIMLVSVSLAAKRITTHKHLQSNPLSPLK